MSSKDSLTSNGTLYSCPWKVSHGWPHNLRQEVELHPVLGEAVLVVEDLVLVEVALDEHADLLAGEAHDFTADAAAAGRACLEPVRQPLGDHHDPGVAVARRHDRHDARVGDPQPLDAAHPQLGVDDRQVVGAHLARARLVVVRVGSRPSRRPATRRRSSDRLAGISSAPTHGANALVAKISRAILTASTSCSRSLGSPR